METYAETNEKVTQVISFDIGIKNFAFCILNVATNSKKEKTQIIKYLEVIDLGTKKGANIQNTIDACLRVLDEIVYQKLDLTLDTVVLIESQMTSVMKCIQTAINVFFKVIAKYDSLNVATKYLSAKHKLSLTQQYSDYTEPECKTTSKYRQNKQDSVHLCIWLLENKLNDNNILEKIKAAKKKDDMADCLLMCMYYANCCM